AYAKLVGGERAERASAEDPKDEGEIAAGPGKGGWAGNAGESLRGGQAVEWCETGPEPSGGSEMKAGYAAATVSNPGEADTQQRRVIVHLVAQNKTESLSLEDYILGVVLAEASVEPELEALKAQAVISRTYALKNLRRHAHDGYDFCSTTHCQRYIDPAQKPETEQLARRAVAETAGQVLVDSHGRLIDAYFGGSCGGMTADIGSLWGVPAPSYLKGVPDQYCLSMPHSHWIDKIQMAKLTAALRSDPRTDPGAGLADVKVVRSDHTGRAEIIEIDGAKRKTVSGWVFKIVVGRALGWNVLISSRFKVERHGGDFIFRGSGFGHGLGLCQEGSHVMASRGFAYRAILSHYLPGTRVTAGPGSGVSQGAKLPRSSEVTAVVFEVDPAGPPNLVAAVDGRQARLSSEHFRLRYSTATVQSDAVSVLGILESARRDLLHRLSAASVRFDSTRVVDVIMYGTTPEYTGATGLPWWSAGVTHGGRIDLQPIGVLKRRGVATTTLRHEYAHCVIEVLSRGHAPRWLEEGLAAYFAGEGQMLEGEAGQVQNLSPDEIDRHLAHPASQLDMRAMYAAAYRQVALMVESKGESDVWRSLSEYAATTGT
ncbi:MAG: SpoIID/LytB domain-containing protein, partial [Blastocatellia bacterium]